MAETVADANYSKEIEKYNDSVKKARRELRALISSKNCAPIMLRLAMHEAERYDAEKKTGGPDGSTRFEEELSHEENKDLKLAVELCEEIKVKHPKISYADLYQLAGVVAVEVTGGPTIEFLPGRKDAEPPKEKEIVPDVIQAAKRLRDTFHKMGLSDQDIVALSGTRALDPYTSGFHGPWSIEPLKFDNTFFMELRDSKRQLPRDKALVEDDQFKPYVLRYAENEDAFFEDYAAAHKKLLDLGFKSRDSASTGPSPPPPSPPVVKPTAAPIETEPSLRINLKYNIIAQSAVGVAVAAVVVILGYVYHVSRRSRPT